METYMSLYIPYMVYHIKKMHSQLLRKFEKALVSNIPIMLHLLYLFKMCVAPNIPPLPQNKVWWCTNCTMHA